MSEGVEVLLENTVVPAVLFFDKASTHCRLCFGILPLPRRPHFPHCSVACRAADHQLAGERAALAAIAPRVPAPAVLLAVRMLLAVRDMPSMRDQVDEMVDNFDAQVQPLASSCSAVQLLWWPDVTPQTKKHPMYLAMARLVLLTAPVELQVSNTGHAGDPSMGLGEDSVTRLMARINQNVFTVADAELQPLGLVTFSLLLGLYLRASAINHSCRPSLVSSYHFTPGKCPHLCLRTVESVPVGGELTHAYIDLCVPKADRRRELLCSYAFACECPGCQASESQADTELFAAAATSRTQALDAIEQGNWGGAAEKLQSALPGLRKLLPVCAPVRYSLELGLKPACNLNGTHH
eukprot:gene8750-23_t